MNIEHIAKKAKEASIKLASLSSEIKNEALERIADTLEENLYLILEANQKDLYEAQIMVKNEELSESVYDRLKLDINKARDMIQGIRDLTTLEDPINKRVWAKELAEGLELHKITCPIGVIGVIFEARPDVVAQIASLAIKSANAILLKGGKEAKNTNILLAELINKTISELKGFPQNTINLLLTRDDVSEMLRLDEYIDLIIPRGSNKMVKYIQENTKIPVLGHADGICHIYIDESADLNKVIPICIDAKCQYPSACNAVETILINNSQLATILPPLCQALQDNGVKIKADNNCLKLCPELSAADETDWKTEYSDKIVSIKTVESLDEAISHINKFGSGHTDCIITQNEQNADKFMRLVDSAGVFKNASTRFSDGFRYGFGAEVGISTNKTHARGPVGLEGLTIYKYKLFGNGDIVADFCNEKRKYTHKML